MLNYTVNFVVRDWIYVSVKADSQEQAIDDAKKIVDSSGYKDKRIDIMDGNIEFAGITLEDVINQIGN